MLFSRIISLFETKEIKGKIELTPKISKKEFKITITCKIINLFFCFLSKYKNKFFIFVNIKAIFSF